MLRYLPVRYHGEAAVMRHKLMERVLRRAVERRSDPKWKARQYAIMYGAGLKKIIEGECDGRAGN